MPANVPVGTWVELGQREVNDLADLVGINHKRTKRMVGREKEQFDRQAKRQKIRQQVGSKPKSPKVPE
jgi:23S rRNA pseudouridine2605 synthase